MDRVLVSESYRPLISYAFVPINSSRFSGAIFCQIINYCQEIDLLTGRKKIKLDQETHF